MYYGRTACKTRWLLGLVKTNWQTGIELHSWPNFPVFPSIFLCRCFASPLCHHPSRCPSVQLAACPPRTHTLTLAGTWNFSPVGEHRSEMRNWTFFFCYVVHTYVCMKMWVKYTPCVTDLFYVYACSLKPTEH